MEVARWIVAVVAQSGFGGFVAAAVVTRTASQHLRLGLLSLAILFGFRPLTLPLFLVATATAAMYYIAMVLAPLFPGTAWFDPEFKDTFPRPFVFHPQQMLGYVVCALLVLAVILAAQSRV